MHKIIPLLLSLFVLISTDSLNAESGLDVEELRLAKIEHEFPKLLWMRNFNRDSKNGGNDLWLSAVASIKQDQLVDDRPLYWNRLAMRRLIKSSDSFQKMTKSEQEKLLWQFELISRGQKDVNFDKQTDKKILITGFDPFFLDRHVNQSNPSGAAAQFLDGEVIELNGVTAEIESVILPVRFADFDQGMVEELLAPYYGKVDMIATISMGRTDFDLERFPGLRRSAEAPGNLNVYTGANKKNPQIPMLDGKPLKGPEFVEFSLPVQAMMIAKGPFKIIDNHKVETLNGKMEPASLVDLAGEVAVSGAGGGYLSNEISYRSILLRNKLNPELPVGHIHTPRIQAFEPETTDKIIKQIREMLRLAIAEI